MTFVIWHTTHGDRPAVYWNEYDYRYSPLHRLCAATVVASLQSAPVRRAPPPWLPRVRAQPVGATRRTITC